jgi:hypothetical protein
MSEELGAACFSIRRTLLNRNIWHGFRRIRKKVCFTDFTFIERGRATTNGVRSASCRFGTLFVSARYADAMRACSVVSTDLIRKRPLS